MKAVLLLGVILVSPLVLADGMPRDKLVSVLAAQDVVAATDPEVVILGGADVALSQGPWSEENVQAFTQTYGYRPTVLPLTHIQSTTDDTADDGGKPRRPVADFYQADARSAYYLYANLPTTGALQQRVQEKLKNLMTDEFQDRLSEEGFTALPDVYQQLWRVRLGVVPPRYTGGYL